VKLTTAPSPLSANDTAPVNNAPVKASRVVSTRGSASKKDVEASLGPRGRSHSREPKRLDGASSVTSSANPIEETESGGSRRGRVSLKPVKTSVALAVAQEPRSSQKSTPKKHAIVTSPSGSASEKSSTSRSSLGASGASSEGASSSGDVSSRKVFRGAPQFAAVQQRPMNDSVISSARKTPKGSPPLTPQSEFKLLADDLSPSFGGVAGQQRLTSAQAPAAYSPMVPASTNKSQVVPSSREWYASSSSEGSNEWSNGIPEFSFSEAGSPVVGGGHPVGVEKYGMGIGFATSVGGRTKRRTGEGQDGDLDTSFGVLFSDDPSKLRAGGHHHDFEDDGEGYSGMKRRKKRRGSSDYAEGVDMKGSPLSMSALRAVTPEGGSEHMVVRCNCKRSKCLKLYCDCLRANKYCEGCNCSECNNTIIYSSARNAAVASIMERNPDAFKARICEDPLSMSKEHLQGCHCKKSACLKKYCECFSVSDQFSW